MLVGSICSLPRSRVSVNCQLSERFALHRVCRRTRNECSSFSGDTNFPLPRPSPVSSRPPIGTQQENVDLLHTQSIDCDNSCSGGRRGGKLWALVSTGAGYRLGAVGDTQEICSTLVRPGAGLTTELFHSSRSETFDSSSDAGGGNVLQYDETLGEMDPYFIS